MSREHPCLNHREPQMLAAIAAGCIQASETGSLGQRVPAELTTVGTAALTNA